MRSKNWPTADGEVVESRIDKKIKKRETKYKLRLHYRFNVNSQHFEGDSLSFGARDSIPDEATANEMLNRYKAGTLVKVIFNPANPSQNALTTGSMTATLIALGVMAVILVVTLL